MPPRPDWADDLDAGLANALAMLARGAADRRHGFHVIQIASVDDAGAPDVRSVVLRAVDRAAGTIRFHTDARSPKVAQLTARPAVMVHGYDPGGRLQLRLGGTAHVHRDDIVADAAWTRTGAMGRRCYAVVPGPGAVLAGPDAAGEDIGAMRANFAAVVVTLARIEWLWLHSGGNRRAVYARDGDGWRGEWVAA